MPISMIIKYCIHCDEEVEKCKFQRAMRNFGLEEFADILTEEEEVGPPTDV